MWGVEPKIGVGYPPKWMVKTMENPINKWMIWGYHYFWKHPCRCLYILYVYIINIFYSVYRFLFSWHSLPVYVSWNL